MSINVAVLSGNLTRNPESFLNGKAAKFGVAVSERRKNKDSGEWEDHPVFVDVEVYSRGDYTGQVDFVNKNLQKGSPVIIDGRLAFDQWQDKASGQNRSKLKVIADSVQLQRGQKGGGDDDAAPAGSNPARNGRRAAAQTAEDDSSIPF